MSRFWFLLRKSIGRERGLTSGLLALITLALPPAAFAHHPIFEPQLGGIAICVDADSVTARVDGPLGRDPGSAEVLTNRIRTALEAETKRVARAFYSSESCPPEAQQLRLEASARYLNPENYIGFPDNSYSFRAYIHVGDLQMITSPATADTDLPFVWTTGGVHSESVAESPVIEHVSLASAAGLERLSQEWVEQNPEPGLRYWLVALTALAAVTILVSVAAANWAKPTQEGGRDR